MTRRSTAGVLGAGAVICSLTSCGLLSSHHVDAPPIGGRNAALWWERTADSLPSDLLATYVAASEVHRRNGTSATYVDRQAYHSMLGGPSYERRLPAPPPDGILDRMRERLKSCDVTRRWNTLGSVAAEECTGCSPEDANAIWQAAIESATLPNEATIER